MSCGVLQGSALNPLLWNVAYDVVLHTALPPNCHIVYADDTLIVVKGFSWKRAITNGNVTMAYIVSAIEDLGFSVVPAKTEAGTTLRPRSSIALTTYSSLTELAGRRP